MSWTLFDNTKENLVSIYKDQFNQHVTQKKIYNGNRVEFFLMYNPLGKMLGYQLKYDYKNEYPKSVLFNSFMIFYNQKKEVNSKDVELDIIYEDQAVRLLAYKHKSGVKDYMLIGRWRTETESTGEEENG
jgi:hypothetical protein